MQNKKKIFFLFEKKYSHFPNCNIWIIFFFIVIYFLDNVTRYKHFLTILMYFNACFYAIKDRKNVINIFKNNLFLSLIIFTISMCYSLCISQEIGISLKAINKGVLEKLFATTIGIAIVLYKEKPEHITKMLIFSLNFSILPLSFKEITQYVHEYHNNIMPLSKFEHRYISDWLIFVAPAIFYIQLYKKIKYKILFFLLSIFFITITIGTLQRGTWLSISVIFTIWCIIKSKLSLLSFAIISLGATLYSLSIINKGQMDKLFYKIEQTDSGNRYNNGTQDAALDLIKENPIIGYGYGEYLFYKVYNKRAFDYPRWIFKRSIGPHNTVLSVWFAAGILGLVAIIYLFISIFIHLLRGYYHYNKAKDGFLILMMIFIGDIIIRGLFETVNIANMAIIIGIALALNNSKKLIN